MGSLFCYFPLFTPYLVNIWKNPFKKFFSYAIIYYTFRENRV